MTYLNEHRYWVYLMASNSRVLYCKVTSSIARRVKQHKDGRVKGFTQRYKCNRLVWYAEYEWIQGAIAREKAIKYLRRELKDKLVTEQNPSWADLSEGWYEPERISLRLAERADSSASLRNDNVNGNDNVSSQ